MCKPYILRFWSPFTTISAEHERMTRPRNPPSGWIARNNRGDHTYYYVSCRDDKTVLASPLCQVHLCSSTPYSAPRNRTKDFCKDDETCKARVQSFADRFDQCRSKHSKEGNAFLKYGENALLRDGVKTTWWEWCSAYEQHLLCPQRRAAQYDNDYPALLRAGIAIERETLPSGQRMGKDPRRFELGLLDD